MKLLLLVAATSLCDQATAHFSKVREHYSSLATKIPEGQYYRYTVDQLNIESLNLSVSKLTMNHSSFNNYFFFNFKGWIRIIL